VGNHNATHGRPTMKAINTKRHEGWFVRFGGGESTRKLSFVEPGHRWAHSPSPSKAPGISYQGTMKTSVRMLETSELLYGVSVCFCLVCFTWLWASWGVPPGDSGLFVWLLHPVSTSVPVHDSPLWAPRAPGPHGGEGWWNSTFYLSRYQISGM